MKHKHYLFYGLILCIGLLSIIACNDDDKEPEPPAPKAPYLHQGDSLALVDIWQKGDGKNWDIKWDLNNFYTWIGIQLIIDSTTMECRVVKLDIPYGAKNATLSPKIGDLEYLLNFQICDGFYGPIPKEIGKLKYLNFMWISSTQLSGEVPKEIFQLKNLSTLMISGNKNLTHLPDEIANYNPTNFSKCILDNNGFIGKVPKGIKVRANLSYNNFTEIPFEYFTDPDAPEIEVAFNRVSGTIPDEVLNNPQAMKKLMYCTYPQQKGYGYSNIPEKYLNNRP